MEARKHRRQHHYGASREAWQKRKAAANAARGPQQHPLFLGENGKFVPAYYHLPHLAKVT